MPTGTSRYLITVPAWPCTICVFWTCGCGEYPLLILKNGPGGGRRGLVAQARSSLFGRSVRPFFEHGVVSPQPARSFRSCRSGQCLDRMVTPDIVTGVFGRSWASV